MPEGKSELLVFDDNLARLGVRLRKRRKRTWIVQFRVGNKQRRKTIGTVGAMPAGKAREAAKNDLASVQLGHDPQAKKIEQRARALETFELIATQFLGRQKGPIRPRSYEQVAAKADCGDWGDPSRRARRGIEVDLPEENHTFVAALGRPRSGLAPVGLLL